jgi:hypothetical protein
MNAIATAPAKHRCFDTAHPVVWILVVCFDGYSFSQIVCAFLYRRRIGTVHFAQYERFVNARAFGDSFVNTGRTQGIIVRQMNSAHSRESGNPEG